MSLSRCIGQIYNLQLEVDSVHALGRLAVYRRPARGPVVSEALGNRAVLDERGEQPRPALIGVMRAEDLERISPSLVALMRTST